MAVTVGVQSGRITMLVFIDTEFSDFDNPRLISVDSEATQWGSD